MIRKVEAVGHRVIVKVKPIEKKHDELSKGGIVLEVKTDSKLQREQEAISLAYVIDVGPSAYRDEPVPWCKIGDLVQISRYSGALIDNVEEGCVYRVINDQDVQVRFPDEGIK